LASANKCYRIAWVLGIDRLLPKIHQALWHNCQAPHKLTEEERVRVDWNDEATAAFLALKQAMMTTPVLQLPDFQK
jgi:hypothetical protein